MASITLTVNGSARTIDVRDPEKPLLYAIRNDLGLKGAKYGCGLGQCGSCTILVDGEPVRSCTVPVSAFAGKKITTIEGLAEPDGTMHPMQAAFKECHGLQCGYCTTGMVMSAVDLCQHHPKATAGEIRELLEGNICRCTGYQNIIKAVQQGQAAMAS